MRFSKRFGAVLGAALILSSPIGTIPAGLTAIAQAKSAALTAEKIDKFCQSLPEVKKITTRHAKQKGKEVAGAADQLTAVLAAAGDDEGKKEVEAAVRSHGFAGTKEWLSVGQSIVAAYAHIKTGGMSEKAQKKLDKAIRKIEKNDFLDDKQKAELIKALRKGADGALEAPPAENVAAVRPMVGKIEAVMQ
jgi:hypothetical protein